MRLPERNAMYAFQCAGPASELPMLGGAAVAFMNVGGAYENALKITLQVIILG